MSAITQPSVLPQAKPTIEPSRTSINAPSRRPLAALLAVATVGVLTVVGFVIVNTIKGNSDAARKVSSEAKLESAEAGISQQLASALEGRGPASAAQAAASSAAPVAEHGLSSADQAADTAYADRLVDRGTAPQYQESKVFRQCMRSLIADTVTALADPPAYAALVTKEGRGSQRIRRAENMIESIRLTNEVVTGESISASPEQVRTAIGHVNGGALFDDCAGAAGLPSS
jgi:hypothetical protein